MIKAVAKGKRGQPVVILGLSAENMKRLMANKPIPVKLRQLHPDLPDLDILILGGQTEDDIAEDLRSLGGQPHEGDPADTAL